MLGRTFSSADLTQKWCSGKVALAYPLFGTTATYFLAVRQYWGAEKWETWCRGLRSNKALLVDGNSMVVNLVGRAEAWLGLTDSDDVAAGQRERLPIAAAALSDIPPMLIPNTIAFVANRPHPTTAQQLVEFLRQPQIAGQLTQAHALESPDSPKSVPARLHVDYPELLHDLEGATKKMEEIFLK